MANSVISEHHRNLCFSFAFISFIVFTGAQVVPSVIVFGDSLVDVGNNNFLALSLAKANFRHNGVDFFEGKSTGRFSNGKNAADLFAEKLGLQTSPPYLSTQKESFFLKKIKKDSFFLKRIKNDESNAIKAVLQNGGISFASGGAGILNETDKIFVQSISLDEQTEFFSSVHGELEQQQLGKPSAASYLAKSIFLISIGGNDIIGYSKPDSDLPGKYGSPQNYIDTLMFTFRRQLKGMFDLGARKFAILGAAKTGCCPSLRRETGLCNEGANSLSLLFNKGVASLLQELKTELGINYSILLSYNLVDDFISQPAQHGFTEVRSACCGLGKFHADVPCLPIAELCEERNSFLFWDLYHPTEAAARKVIDRFFSGTDGKYVFPINVNQLVGVA
ncbi:hypothetical protein MKW92_036166 [Papaver armeniacum]|nr:hypothetical protein MKW92_036166 [Papaver armeniacum]